MKILIADDEAHNRLLMEKILSPYGHCDLVVNGKEAIEACEMALLDGDPYDLVCLDIMMPEMDGQEALRSIRELERARNSEDGEEMVIFMVSALNTEEQVVQAFFRGGCTDYLGKPVTRDKVLEKMRQYNLIDE
ncbi:Chemotaxis protein CheY [Candidatus Magnetaquicoccaceae bacterium FCR-1]|uniref:Chemotaxis protein CheY n=1 Tax=Candidatus Magnetaquiglobus chichijimensis TaxID=3141448 RepID=A0ABQ0C9P5_9PROT